MSRNEVSRNAEQNPLCNARLRQEALARKGFSDLTPAVAWYAMSQNESKDLLLGSVKILFPHRMFVVSMWNSTRTLENDRSGALNACS